MNFMTCRVKRCRTENSISDKKEAYVYKKGTKVWTLTKVQWHKLAIHTWVNATKTYSNTTKHKDKGSQQTIKVNKNECLISTSQHLKQRQSLVHHSVSGIKTWLRKLSY